MSSRSARNAARAVDAAAATEIVGAEADVTEDAAAAIEIVGAEAAPEPAGAKVAVDVTADAAANEKTNGNAARL